MTVKRKTPDRSPDPLLLPLSEVFGLLSEVFLEPEADVKARLAAVLGRCPERCPGLDGLPGALRSMMEHCGPSHDQALEFVRLFLHGNGNRTVHPYESVYTHGQLMAPECLESWKALHGEVGIHPRADLRVPPDHLGLELEFLSYALTRFHAEPEPRTRASLGAAAATALRQHLIPFSRMFVGRLTEAQPSPYYANAGRSLVEALHASTLLLRLGPASQGENDARPVAGAGATKA